MAINTYEDKLTKIAKLYQECITLSVDKKEFELTQGFLNLLRQHTIWKQNHPGIKA